MFEVALTETAPVSQEDHLEFHWLPLGQLADAEVRPGPLKDALLTAGPPLWHGWNGIFSPCSIQVPQPLRFAPAGTLGGNARYCTSSLGKGLPETL